MVAGTLNKLNLSASDKNAYAMMKCASPPAPPAFRMAILGHQASWPTQTADFACFFVHASLGSQSYQQLLGAYK